MAKSGPFVGASVPCDGCTLCCRNDAIFLHPEMGDRASDYLTEVSVNPLTGKPSLMVAKQANGDCVYLDRATGCTIHGRAPAICQEFDCRRFYRALVKDTTRADRKRMVAQGVVSKGVLDAGRKRLAK